MLGDLRKHTKNTFYKSDYIVKANRNTNKFLSNIKILNKYFNLYLKFNSRKLHKLCIHKLGKFLNFGINFCKIKKLKVCKNNQYLLWKLMLILINTYNK